MSSDLTTSLRHSVAWSVRRTCKTCCRMQKIEAKKFPTDLTLREHQTTQSLHQGNDLTHTHTHRLPVDYNAWPFSDIKLFYIPISGAYYKYSATFIQSLGSELQGEKISPRPHTLSIHAFKFVSLTKREGTHTCGQLDFWSRVQTEPCCCHQDDINNKQHVVKTRIVSSFSIASCTNTG